MNKNPIYIIEHLEPQLWDWCLIEYEHISQTVGKENLWFTNIKNSKDIKKLEKLGKVFVQSVREMKLQNACVLDPAAPKTLNPSEGFDYYIFGGILGDYPPKKRTGPELTQFMGDMEARDIGKQQMSTDNAVYTVKQIANGRQFNELKFKDKVSIQLDKFEFVDLPYRYNLVDGRPFMSPKILSYLKKNGAFR
jgi:ribosome biogenesis SPOUT family RNA methylase Rps3